MFFLRHVLDFLTATYDELLQNSLYKDTLDETRRLQNVSQSLTNVKDNVLEFFIEVDKMKYQLYEKTFNIQGPNVFNFVQEKLLKNEGLFEKYKHLLQNFEFNEEYVKCDESMALSSLKELYCDLVWRFCRVAENQFRKDMIRTFRKQKSEALKKRVTDAPCGSKDSSNNKISMANIINDDSEGKQRTHLKLQSLILDTGNATFKTFTKKKKSSPYL